MKTKQVHIYGRFARPLFLLVCLTALLWVASTPVGAVFLPSTGKPSGFAVTLRPLLLAHMQDLSVPGAIVYVNDPGQGAWSTALGTSNIASGAPIQVKSSIRIGSITKTLTATVILHLVDRHKLGLDDPVSTYLSQVPNGMHITICELLTMTSGLFSYTEELGFEKQAWGAAPFKLWTPQALLAIAYQHPPDFPPGEGWHYSNTNTILLGLLIEQRTHLSVEQAFQRYLFESLEIDQTSLPSRTSAAIPDPHPHGYSLLLPGRTQPVDATNWNPSWAWAAGAPAIVPGHKLIPRTSYELFARIEYGEGDRAVSCKRKGEMRRSTSCFA